MPFPILSYQVVLLVGTLRGKLDEADAIGFRPDPETWQLVRDLVDELTPEFQSDSGSVSADGVTAIDIVTCDTCGRSWDDALVSSVTPVPAGRCPFEYEHDSRIAEARETIAEMYRRMDAYHDPRNVPKADVRTWLTAIEAELQG